jgi:hypothetical protein
MRHITGRLRSLILVTCALTLSIGAQVSESKAEKKQREAQEKKMEVSLRQLSLFPQTYANETRRLKRVLLGPMRQQSFGTDRVYVLDAKQDKTQIYNSIRRDSFAIVADDKTARLIDQYYEKHSDTFREYYPANVMLTISKLESEGNQAYIGKVGCIQFLGLFGNIWDRINCQ